MIVVESSMEYGLQSFLHEALTLRIQCASGLCITIENEFGLIFTFSELPIFFFKNQTTSSFFVSPVTTQRGTAQNLLEFDPSNFIQEPGQNI